MASSSSQRRCVFVGNIPYDATEEQLVQICEEVGPVVSFRLVLDRETGKPKGYGFCEYKDEETALSARRNLHGYEINGRQLRVDFAENDKTADRGREQGRGGPGMASSSGAPSILGDSSLHQPIGLQVATAAAATMAKALGEVSLPGADSLTQFLAKMSRHQLSLVMAELKAVATQSSPLARQLLETSQQLPRALFQAQIILNMVTPQVLQMPNLCQPSSSTFSQGLEAQKSIRPSLQGQSHLKPLSQTGILAKLPEGQPQLQQGQHLSQNVLLGKPGNQAFSQPLGGLSVPPLTSRGLLQQQDRPIAPTGGGVHSDVIIQPPLSGRHPPSQQAGVLQKQRIIPPARIPAEYGGYSSLDIDSAWGPQVRIAQEGDHPPKRPKLEEMSGLPQTGGAASYRTRADASQMVGASVAPSLPDKQAHQLPQEMQKTLLEQVKSLTAEQLSLLPPDQRQQVIDLQQRLRLLDGLDAAT